MHMGIYKDVMLVNKVVKAAWLMAIVTPVVAMAAWIYSMYYYTRIILEIYYVCI